MKHVIFSSVFCGLFLASGSGFCQGYTPPSVVGKIPLEYGGNLLIAGNQDWVAFQMAQRTAFDLGYFRDQTASRFRLQEEQNSMMRTGIASASALSTVSPPALAAGENWVGIGGGGYSGKGAIALGFARGLGNGGVVRATAATGGAFGVSAGFKF